MRNRRSVASQSRRYIHLHSLCRDLNSIRIRTQRDDGGVASRRKLGRHVRNKSDASNTHHTRVPAVRGVEGDITSSVVVAAVGILPGHDSRIGDAETQEDAQEEAVLSHDEAKE